MPSARDPAHVDGHEPIGAFLPDAQPPEASSATHQLSFPTVALGASAGGVQALQRLFAAMPANTGCAFVVLMHLAPDVKSQLAPLLSHSTAMPVLSVDKDTDVRPNNVYVITPGNALEMHGGRLHAARASDRHARPLAVDRFMVSLAADQRERAVGVVLSGTDGDGAVGVKAIKSEGGFTIAQLPASAAHAGMPSSAVATGQVDQQLTIEEIPAAISAFVDDAGLALHADGSDAAVDLSSVLDMLRRQTGLDFSGYKRPMLQRRVQRRMALSRLTSFADYVHRLQGSPAEGQALAADFLIGVTEFFREPESWKVLAHDVLPAMLEGKQTGEAVRVWVPGCATGQEAYSIAMQLLDAPQLSDKRLQLQVFATDIDAEALDVARKGRYPHSIESAVSAERLRRYFVSSDGFYQVRKDLRDVVTFAPQNLVTDPPFSHMDLISCRNLLIYLEPDLQRRALQVFHFALATDGILALGKSETVGTQAASFRTVSQSARIFRRVGPQPAVGARRLRRTETAHAAFVTGASPRAPVAALDYAHAVREALLEHRPTTAVLTNREGQTLYFYGPVRRYIEFPQGAPSTDLFAMLDATLRPHVRAAMHQALNEHRVVTTTAGVPVDENEQPVRVSVSPVVHPTADDLLLVTFEDAEARVGQARLASGDASDVEALRALEEELRTTKRELRIAIEELESTNEELKVANEEAMSSNEELQSSNEELETSQEELQSVNEEVTAVNSQLESKVFELERANDDLSNLLSSTSIPTLFLDRQLCIKRFTPAVTRLFNLIASDLERPITDLASHDDTDAVVHDAEAVLKTLTPQERETQTADGRVYLRRTLPYRTQEDRIDGVVITFIDVTELKAAAEGLRRYAAVMQGSTDAVLVHDANGQVLAWNRGAEAMYGYSAEEALQMRIDVLVPPEAQMEYAAAVQRALAGQSLSEWDLRRRRRDGSELQVAASVSLIRDPGGAPHAVSLIERDVTPRVQAEARLRESELRFRTLANTAPVLIWMADQDGTLEFANQEFGRFVGEPGEQLRRRSLREWLHRDDAPRVMSALAALRADDRFGAKLRLAHSDGSHRWVQCSAMLQADTAPRRSAVVGSMVDIDAQVRAEESVREANRNKDEFLAMLGHELRNPLAPIRNAAEVLRRIGVHDERLTWVHDVLVRQTNHVTRLVDDLLDISLITRGSMQLRMEPLDLLQVIRRAVDEAMPWCRHKRHELATVLPAEAVWVEGDPIRLLQVFGNLLSNAAKYTDEGGRIELVVEAGDDFVTVSVIDNGLGLSPEMQTRAFDLFVQDQRSIDRSQGGLGIGLALVRHLVTMHGGQVEASSPGLGQGSKFEVRLRRWTHAAVPALSPEPELPEDGVGRVLLVDDDRDGAESMRMLLETSGFRVATAFDLESALAVAATLRPQVVLTDIAISGADGYEIGRRLRAQANGAASPMVVMSMSGYGRESDYERGRQEGFACHFVKPVDPFELDRVLRDALRGLGETGKGA